MIAEKKYLFYSMTKYCVGNTIEIIIFAAFARKMPLGLGLSRVKLLSVFVVAGRQRNITEYREGVTCCEGEERVSKVCVRFVVYNRRPTKITIVRGVVE